MNNFLPIARKPKPLRSRAFTLTELLVVIALMGIMASLGTPALLNSAKGSKVTHAGNTLADLAVLARQKSASGNAMVAIVLVTNSQIEPTRGQAVGIFEFASDRTWRQAGGWMRLPEGIRAEMESSPESLKKLSDAQITVSGTTLAENDYSALVFYSDGRMCGEPNTAAPKVRAYDSATQNSSPNSYDLVFNIENSAFSISRP